jgi:hypothetical protein
MRTQFVTWVAQLAAVSLSLTSCLPRLEVAAEANQDGSDEGPEGGTPSNVIPGTDDAGRASDGGVDDRGNTGGSAGSGDAGGDVRPPPNAPLNLMGVQPADLAEGVPIDAPITLTFSDDIDPASVSALAIEVLPLNSSPITGTLRVEGKQVEFLPSEPLILANSYAWRYQGTLRARDGSVWTGTDDATFQTRDGEWSLPQNLSPTGDLPRLAFDSAGNALAIWNQIGARPSGASGLGVARFTLGTGWEVLPPQGSCGPQCTVNFVAGGDEGVFELSWYEVDNLHYQPYLAATGFGETRSILARSGPPETTGVVTGSDLWMATNLATGIAVEHNPHGAGWQGGTLSLDEDRGSTAGPVLVVDGPERARVFWVERSQLRASILSDGSWSAPLFVQNFRGDFTAAGLAGAGVAGGNALLAWEEERPSLADPTQVASFLGVALMGANGSIQEEDGPKLPDGVTGNPASPAIAMSPTGEGVLAWLQSSGDPNDANAAATLWWAFHSPTATTWSAPEQISRTGQGVARPPAVGMDASGNGHAVWVSVRASGEANVLTARFVRETESLVGLLSLATPAAPALTRGGRSGNDNCQLAVDAQGRALVVWVGADGGIWTTRFE